MACTKNPLYLSSIAAIVNYYFPKISSLTYPVAKSGSGKRFNPIKFIYPSYSTSSTASKAIIISLMPTFKMGGIAYFCLLTCQDCNSANIAVIEFYEMQPARYIAKLQELAVCDETNKNN
jgi:hypothetical protein